MLKLLKDQRELIDKAIKIQDEKQNRPCQRFQKMEKKLEVKNKIPRMMHISTFKDKNDNHKKD